MGYPKDDEYSKQAGCCGDFPCNCTADLSVFYPHQYVQNEEIANIKSGEVCAYRFEKTPILKHTIVGTIYYDRVPLYTFHDREGEVVLAELKEKDKHPDRLFPTVVSGFVNYETNTMSLTWNRKIHVGNSYLVTCYEYNLECQNTPPIECPKCNHKFYPPCDDALTLEQLVNGEGNLDLY